MRFALEQSGKTSRRWQSRERSEESATLYRRQILAGIPRPNFLTEARKDNKDNLTF
jgi:hypothetical protein